MSIDLRKYVDCHAAILRDFSAPYVETVQPTTRSTGQRCDSCGSSEWIARPSGHVCAYCRGAPVTASKVVPREDDRLSLMKKQLQIAQMETEWLNAHRSQVAKRGTTSRGPM